MAHPEGSFPVHFLGSEEYQWISRNRVFPYEIGLQTSSAKDTSGSNKIEKAFSRCKLKNRNLYFVIIQYYIHHLVLDFLLSNIVQLYHCLFIKIMFYCIVCKYMYTFY